MCHLVPSGWPAPGLGAVGQFTDVRSRAWRPRQRLSLGFLAVSFGWPARQDLPDLKARVTPKDSEALASREQARPASALLARAHSLVLVLSRPPPSCVPVRGPVKRQRRAGELAPKKGELSGTDGVMRRGV